VKTLYNLLNKIIIRERIYAHPVYENATVKLLLSKVEKTA
jgi:predicted NAD/FAD-binding protein